MDESFIMQMKWAEIWLETLSQMGVDQAIISPGSRSTPLVLAVLRSQKFQCHSIVDERSAGFFALGQAKITGKPSLLICTSGSALSHYFPAVMEAYHAYIPLLVASADRPFELHHSGANQTTQQSHLFGNFARFFMDIPPITSSKELVAAARFATQAYANSLAPIPGPVHFNFQFRKPLESCSEWEGTSHKKTEWTLSKCRAEKQSIEQIVFWLRNSQSPLIVGGPWLPFRQSEMARVIRFADQTQIPVFMECTSQGKLGDFSEHANVQWVDGLDSVLRSNTEGFDPDCVLFVGDVPTSKGIEIARKRWSEKTKQIVIHPHRWSDPENNIDFMLQADLGDTFSQLSNAFETQSFDVGNIKPWKQKLKKENEYVWSTIEHIWSDNVSSEELSESYVLKYALKHMPNDAVLSLGNSLSVRLVDIWCRQQADKKIQVVSQRGLSGIDGLIAGTMGTNSVSKKTTVLILGDVSFLHDMTSLQLAKAVRTPFVIVVVHNQGGRIFEHLPVNEQKNADQIMPFFTTPHDTNFQYLAKQFEIKYSLAKTNADFQTAYAESLNHKGCSLIEARVPPHHAKEQLHALHQKLRLEKE